jgi:hypothetical protein
MRRCATAILLLTLAAGCGPKTMKARMEAGERQSDRAAGALDDADKALAAGDFDRADERVKEADRTLSDPDVMTNPEAELLKTRLSELKVKVPAARKQREAEELAKKVAARREVIAKAVTQFRRDISKLEGKPGDRAALQAARDAAKKVHDEMEWDKDLQSKDAEFKGYVDGLRQDLQDGDKALATAEKVMAFIDGPVKLREDAAAAMVKARAEKVPDEKVKQLTEVQDAYKRCAADAERAFADAQGLDKATVVSSPRPLTGALVVKDCKAQEGAAGKLLASAKKAADLAAKKAEIARKKAEAAEKKKAAAEAKKEAKKKNHARR